MYDVARCHAGTDLSPILPVLAKVFDQALAGGGAKSINFQELAADLAQARCLCDPSVYNGPAAVC